MTTLIFTLLGQDKLSPAMKSAEKSSDSLGRKLGGFGRTAGVALLGVTTAAGALAGAGAVMGVKTAAGLEQANIAFTTLLGSGQKAQTFLDGLKTFAAKTPFELPGLIDASRLLLGVGVSADQVTPMLQSFGDTASAVGIKQDAFQRIMLATSQAISAGRFQVGDLNQIMTNGIPVWTILSKAMGKPVPELRQMASQGKLLSKDVLPLLQAQMGKDYGGAMAAQSQTLNGIWSTFMDTLSLGLADAIKPLIPVMKVGLSGAITFMGKAFAAVPGVAAKVFSILGDVKDNVVKLWGVVGPFVRGALHEFILGFSALAAAFSGEGVTSTGFIGFMEHVGVTARTVFDYFRSDVLPRLRDFGKYLISFVIPGLVSLGTSILKIVWPPLRTLFKFFATEVLPRLLSFGQFVGTNTALIKGLAIGIGALLVITKAHNTVLAAQAAITTAGGIGAYIKNIKIVTMVTKLWTAVQWALNIAFSPIGLVVIGIGLLVAGVIIAYKHSTRFREAVDAVGNALKTGFLAAVRGVTTAIHAVGDAFQAVGSAVGTAVDAVGNFFQTIGSAVATGVGAVVGFFASLPGKILDALGDLGGMIMDHVVDPILAPFKAAAKWLEPVWPHLLIGLQNGVKLAMAPAQLVYDHVILPIANAFSKASTWLVEKGKDLITGLKNGVVAIATTISVWLYENVSLPIINAFSKAGSWLVEKGKDFVTGLKNGVVTVMTTIAKWTTTNVITPLMAPFGLAINWLLGPGKNFVAGLKNGIVSIARTIGRFVYDNVVSPIVTAFSMAGTWLVQRGKDIVTGLKNGVAFIIKAGKGVGRWFYDNVIVPAVKPFAKAGTWLFSHGKNMIAGLKDGAVAILKNIGSWIKEKIVDPIVQGVKNFFGIKSPSTVFAGIGGNMVKGLFKGLGSINIGKAIQKIFGGMPAALRGIVGKGLVALADLPAKARDALSDAVGIGDPIGGPRGAPKDRAGIVALMRTVATQYGWGSGGQWDSLYALEMGEAGFNPNAQNPTSTAYGLGQFLDSTWAMTGISKTSDPWAQAKAMMIYISQVYGSPANAYAKWSGRSPHWYDQGGWLMPGMVGVNATTEPEAVFTRAQLGDLLGGTRRLHPDDLAALMSAVSRVDVSVDEGALRGVIRVEAKRLDDRQADRLASGRR